MRVLRPHACAGVRYPAVPVLDFLRPSGYNGRMETTPPPASAGIDLHAHTTASDGSLTPTELVQKAAAIGLAALAVTDHDTLGGLAEAQAAAADVGLELVAGVELSVEDEAGGFICSATCLTRTHAALGEKLVTLGRAGRIATSAWRRRWPNWPAGDDGRCPGRSGGRRRGDRPAPFRAGFD